jgi:hypothetical protein
MNVVTPSSKNHFSITINRFLFLNEKQWQNIPLKILHCLMPKFPQKNCWCGHSYTTNLPTS